MGLVAPWHVGCSQTRARTCVPCIGRQILNHRATGEALWYILEGRIFKYTFCFREVLHSEQAGRSTTVNLICWLYDFVRVLKTTEIYTLKW